MNTPDNMTLKTDDGCFIARKYKDENGYTGMLIEYVANDDDGQNPCRPTVRLEFDEDKNLCTNIYDSTSEDPIKDFSYQKKNAQYAIR